MLWPDLHDRVLDFGVFQLKTSQFVGSVASNIIAFSLKFVFNAMRSPSDTILIGAKMRRFDLFKEIH